MCYIFLTSFNSFQYPKKRSEKNLNIYFLIHEKINNNINKREKKKKKKSFISDRMNEWNAKR